MNRRDIPNIISTARILLTVPIIWLLFEEEYDSALILFIIAGVSDGIDGWLAKHYGWQSRLGSILDPVADKLMLMSSYVALAWVGHIDVGLAVAVLLRDLVIMGGATAYHFLVGSYEMRPNWLSKVNTVCQIVLVVWVLLALALWPVMTQAVFWLSVMVWLTTVGSGIQYVWQWGRSALAKENNGHD